MQVSEPDAPESDCKAAAELVGQWRYSTSSGKLSAALQIAKRVYTLAQERNDSELMLGAYRSLAVTLYYIGDFEAARHSAIRGIEIWRSRSVPSHEEDLDAPVVTCLVYEALCAWHFGSPNPNRTWWRQSHCRRS